MSKWHINNDFEVRPCTATTNPCRFTKENHFENKVEALEFANAMLMEEYNILAKSMKMDNKQESTKIKKKSEGLEKAKIKDVSIPQKRIEPIANPCARSSIPRPRC